MQGEIEQHYPGHHARLLQCWGEALEAAGFEAAVVHAGSPPKAFLDDQYYPYQANPHFLAWAPLDDAPGSVLIIHPGQRPLLYLYQPLDYWHAPPEEAQTWWSEHFDLRQTADSQQWREAVPQGPVAFIGNDPAVRGEKNCNPGKLLMRLHLARTQKSSYELGCMRAAQRIACRGYRAAQRAFLAGLSEFEIHQAYLSACGQLDSELPYNSIIALNEHAAVLHYQRRDRQKSAEARSFLIDAGARFNGYCADISRSYSTASGLFSELIKGMEKLQEQLCHQVSAGTNYVDLHSEAHRAIAALLAESEVISASAEAAIDNGLSAVFFPHGVGHFLGLQVHDVAGQVDNNGRGLPPPQAHPNLRLTREMEVGNVVTVEPGLYFIDQLLNEAAGSTLRTLINWDLVESLRPFGRIRIEDNVAVTADGPDNLTRSAFAAER